MSTVPTIRKPHLKRSGAGISILGFIDGEQVVIRAKTVTFNSDGSVTAVSFGGQVYGLRY